jgi:hypothetical protein
LSTNVNDFAQPGLAVDSGGAIEVDW